MRQGDRQRKGTMEAAAGWQEVNNKPLIPIKVRGLAVNTTGTGGAAGVNRIPKAISEVDYTQNPSWTVKH